MHLLSLNRSNFCATKQLLDLARQMHSLRSFVYLSTYYVNNFKPYNTPVLEEVHYPTLQLAGMGLPHRGSPPRQHSKSFPATLAQLCMAQQWLYQ